MEIIKKPSEIHSIAEMCRGKQQKIGFVPTMGAIHHAHLTLVEASKKENDITIVSIFVNPTQFAPHEDFDSYPRPIKEDQKMLKNYGTDFIYYPAVEDIYPLGTTYNDHPLPSLFSILEGEFRPTHFQGVAQVVKKLFEHVHPNNTYFGEKDYQQALLIKWLIHEYGFNINLKILPTIREEDGLAESSRNVYLTKEEKKTATVLYRSMVHARDLIEKKEKRIHVLEDEMRKIIRSEPLVSKLDYAVIRNSENLEKQEYIDENSRALIALKIGKTRLIDNMKLIS